MAKWNCASDEDIQYCEELLNKFNEGKSDEKGCYYITTSGQKREYFCLWNFNPIAIFKPYNYICNLTKDFKTSVEKAIDFICNSSKMIFIDDYDNVKYSNEDRYTFTFGKYKGRLIEDIANSDMSYVIWFVNSYYTKEKRMNNSKKFNTFLEKAQSYVTFYFDQLAEKNRSESESTFVGKVGNQIGNLTLKVCTSRTYIDQYRLTPYYGNLFLQDVTAKDQDKNMYIIRLRTKNPVKSEQYPDYVYQRHEILNIRSARIMEHKEICGIKKTRLGYVIFEANNKEE